MKSRLMVAAVLLCPLFLEGEALEDNEEYEIEQVQASESSPFCIPEGQRGYYRRYYCPHRYCDFYQYETPDTEATWPGKLENSFMEDLMR